MFASRDTCKMNTIHVGDVGDELMMTNEVVALIRDRPRVVSRQLGTMVPGRTDNDRRVWPACIQRVDVQAANASPEATV